jgi:hypothetical protein
MLILIDLKYITISRLNQRRKSMKTLLAIIIALFVTFVSTTAFTAEVKLDSMKVYAFTKVQFPDNSSDQYRLAWGRVGFCLYPRSEMLNKHFLLRVDYNFVAPALKLCYGQVTENWQGNKISFIAGQYLSPVQYNWPSPMTLRQPRWADAWLDLPLVCQGAVAIFDRGKLEMTISHYNAKGLTGNAGLAVTGSYRGLTGYWAKETAQGLILEHSFAWWLNPFVGFTKYDSHFQTKEKVYFVQNYIQGPKGLRLYGLWDFGDTQATTMLTADWAYAKNSSIRVSWDRREDFVRSEMSFAF